VESAHAAGTREVLACDESFFTVAGREELLRAVSDGQLRFAEVTRQAEERSVRFRDAAAVVAGATRMVICYQGDEVTVHSRYTHVYARESGRWLLMSAQGTPTRAPRASVGRVPLFCDTALAGRIERAEAQLIARCSEAARRRAGMAGFVIPVAGGVASFAGEGSPYNKVAGLGFGGVPDPAALDEVEKAFAAHGSAVQVELAELAEPAIAALLARRGYRLESFENVLGRTLAGGLERSIPPGIEVRLSGAEEFEAWLAVVAEGSVHPDTQGVPWHEEFPREVIIAAERDSAAAGTVRYAALRDGIMAGGATMRIAEGVAQLTGAATAPEHRRRGVQSALLSARLADAAAAGCDVAVITTQPGSKSQQNAQRQGFDLLYARAVVVRQP
jgi:GNAT superfamily N-acetyltransferase